MADLRNLKHALSDTRDTIASEVRDDIQTGTGANVTIKFFSQTEDAQTGFGFLSINLGSSPFGTSTITTQSFTYSGTATGTKTSTGTSNANSFAIYNRDATPVKILKGSCGSSTSTNTYNVTITGGKAVAEDEKLKLTSFTYTAAL